MLCQNNFNAQFVGGLLIIYVDPRVKKYIHVEFSLNIIVKIYFNKQERWSGMNKTNASKCATS